MDVLWTEPAEAHLLAIHAFHSRTSKRYADRIIDRITARTVQLALFPQSGPIVPQAESVELRAIFEGPYRILYVVGTDHIDILGVLHGSRGSM